MPLLDDRLLEDFDSYIKASEDMEKWLRDLYYHPEFSSIFNRPVLSLLMAATTYLQGNLTVLKQKYLLKGGE